MAPEERREAILDAAIPLLMTYGNDVTTRQIAEAAGIAEGTVFRVFDDKTALVDAALHRFLDSSRMRDTVLAIDPELPLEEKVRAVYLAFRERMRGIMGMMAAVGMDPPSISSKSRDAFLAQVGELLAHGCELRVDPTTAARLVRMAAFANAIDDVYKSEGVPDTVVLDVLLNGITPRES